MGDSSWNWWLLSREEEVPQRVSSIVLKGVKVVVGPSQGVELHEFIGGGFDEEGTNKLR